MKMGHTTGKTQGRLGKGIVPCHRLLLAGRSLFAKCRNRPKAVVRDGNDEPHANRSYALKPLLKNYLHCSCDGQIGNSHQRSSNSTDTFNGVFLHIEHLYP